MDKEFILWLCRDKLRLGGSVWDDNIGEILDAKYAEYRRWSW